ncbi:DNA-binding domain-containing protein [Teredinibacter sp. KSP-S5-2]|uniref:DNA-binding domain-containing protein n=1 Tax=Teredinibacter sp. KSP-S5-2 TaxID=3034506 RepID=UPI002934C420|nr:DNA-binding domain-containing protein [Teredinibacter sp. KSP-S5-2]WNO09752.1 DNA-binding domain-containing protein [Teredinibacter sp. KSP-S5-2]
MKLSELQRKFYKNVFMHEEESLLQLKQAFPNYSEEELKARISIYKNNTFLSLIDVLAETFPNTQKTVGIDFFTLLAKDYIRHHPPKTASLISYGDHLPSFILQHEKTEHLPYLGDLAQLEFDRHIAYYTEDTPPLTQEDFTRIDVERLADCRITVLSSVRLLASNYAVVSLWRFNNDDNKDDEQIIIDHPEFCITFKDNDEVISYKLEPALYTFLKQIVEQHSIGASLDETLEQHPDFNATEAVQFLVQSHIGERIIKGDNE